MPPKKQKTKSKSPAKSPKATEEEEESKPPVECTTSQEASKGKPFKLLDGTEARLAIQLPHKEDSKKTQVVGPPDTSKEVWIKAARQISGMAFKFDGIKWYKLTVETRDGALSSSSTPTASSKTTTTSTKGGKNGSKPATSRASTSEPIAEGSDTVAASTTTTKAGDDPMAPVTASTESSGSLTDCASTVVGASTVTSSLTSCEASLDAAKNVDASNVGDDMKSTTASTTEIAETTSAATTSSEAEATAGSTGSVAQPTVAPTTTTTTEDVEAPNSAATSVQESTTVQPVASNSVDISSFRDSGFLRSEKAYCYIYEEFDEESPTRPEDSDTGELLDSTLLSEFVSKKPYNKTGIHYFGVPYFCKPGRYVLEFGISGSKRFPENVDPLVYRIRVRDPEYEEFIRQKFAGSEKKQKKNDRLKPLTQKEREQIPDDLGHDDLPDSLIKEWARKFNRDVSVIKAELENPQQRKQRLLVEKHAKQAKENLADPSANKKQGKGAERRKGADPAKLATRRNYSVTTNAHEKRKSQWAAYNKQQQQLSTGRYTLKEEVPADEQEAPASDSRRKRAAKRTRDKEETPKKVTEKVVTEEGNEVPLAKPPPKPKASRSRRHKYEPIAAGESAVLWSQKRAGEAFVDSLFDSTIYKQVQASNNAEDAPKTESSILEGESTESQTTIRGRASRLAARVGGVEKDREGQSSTRSQQGGNRRAAAIKASKITAEVEKGEGDEGSAIRSVSSVSSGKASESSGEVSVNDKGETQSQRATRKRKAPDKTKETSDSAPKKEPRSTTRKGDSKTANEPRKKDPKAASDSKKDDAKSVSDSKKGRI
eukprot:gb/GECG01004794.1/.p1 GENE.gb/GECG01004794.1/~~gb/GECG01004794.1/.p1  ORF type:complete len:827 (+),score=153.57 gb/GECG01004794.1/:1-2481(+)